MGSQKRHLSQRSLMGGHSFMKSEKTISPISKTKFHVSWRDYVRLNIVRGLKLRWMVFLGKCAAFVLKSLQIYQNYKKYSALRNSPGPDAQRIREFSAPRIPQFRNCASWSRSRVLTDQEVLNTNFKKADGYQASAAFLYSFLKNNGGEVKTVVNVGCGLDNIFEWLCRQFEEIRFISNDVMEDLEDLHKWLLPSYGHQKNWQCVVGYQLDLIKRGELQGDLFFCKGTAIAFVPKELESYVELLSQKAKYLYFCESWEQPLKTFNIFRMTRPEDVDPEYPFLGGGGYFFSNYFSLLNKHGFDVIQSDVYPPGKYNLHLLARNRNL